MKTISKKEYLRKLSWGYCSKMNDKGVCEMLVLNEKGITTLESVKVW